jgi:hypothetical protein
VRVRQRGIRLQPARTVLHIAPYIQEGLFTHPQFGGQGYRRFTFQHSAQEQDHLAWREVSLLKNRAGVEIVGTTALATAIDREFTLTGSAKDIGIRHSVATIRTHQTVRMKMIQNPLFAFCRTEQFSD